MGKKLLMVIGIAFAVIFSVFNSYANIDNLSNLSSEWIRTGNRNAATDAADIVFYNPAGLTELSKGYHLNISNQVLIRKPEHSFSGKSYQQDSPDLILPNFYGCYTRDNIAVFGGIYIPGGGATIDYPDGSVSTYLISAMFGGSTAGESLEAYSRYLTYTLGGAYKINDRLSAAAGLRYIDAKNTIEAKITPGGTAKYLETEDTGSGFGGILSANFDATERLNIAVQYQTRVKLDFEKDVKKDTTGANIYTDGEKNRRDFPAFFGLGAGYDISDKLYSEIDFSYWFQKGADWSKDDNGRDISGMAGNAWSFGGSLSYKLDPKFLISGGAVFTKFDWGDIDGYYSANPGSACEALYSDNLHIGTGFAWEFRKNIKLNFSLGHTIWKDEDVNMKGTPVSTKNKTTVIAIGLDMMFSAD